MLTSFFLPLRRCSSVLWGGLLLSTLMLSSCAPPDPLEQRSQAPPPKEESSLTLNNATLEQANAKGQTVWKIQVEEARYSVDGKNATLVNVKGDFYEDGKVVLQVKADKGEIIEDGKALFLRENIVALDPRNKAVLRAQEVEWQTESSILTARQNLKGEHPDLTVTAKEGRYETKEEKLIVSGDVVAVTEHNTKDQNQPKDPRRLELKTDRITWEIKNNRVFGDRPLTLVRFVDQTATDEVKSDQAELLLKQQLVHLAGLNQFKSVEPPLQIAAEPISWYYLTRFVTTDKPISIVDYKQQITVRGNRGAVNLAVGIAKLEQGTNTTSQEQQSQLYADELTYNFGPQTLQAKGNIIYEQQKGVKFNLTGDVAQGSLPDNNVVVTSTSSERVVTEIFPNQ
ncbi:MULTISPECIES: LPS export ABC transporter periplasmic protein LptC [unclassified Synechocystis]|uniref:LPS export ABC transporter periplasmic protein LptC n=1 Tax=unclassified Synechocystis TaxID=2640012 RepID=UPI001CBD47F9|nr:MULTISPECIES: LPS export ABC transporter periplasmic protein LptC [unclassified Synechocystis]